MRDAIRDRWGEDVVGDRKRIGEIVFQDPTELEWLEQLLHPRTRVLSNAWLRQVDRPLAVIEIPLLFETGGETRFDKVVVITAPPGVREERRRPRSTTARRACFRMRRSSRAPISRM